MRDAFHGAIPLRTVVVYCYEPRADEIPAEVAKFPACETYSGEVLLTTPARR